MSKYLLIISLFLVITSCQRTTNSILVSNITELEKCKEECTNNESCVSYEWKESENKCQLSTTCKKDDLKETEDWTTYVKNT